MHDQRLIHDMAWAMTRDVLRVLGESMSDDEKVAAFPAIYCELVEGLTQFVTKRDREWQRLGRKPQTSTLDESSPTSAS